MNRIDARGKSCPQPVIMTKARVEAGDEVIEVVLDNAISASNVQRFLEKNGYAPQLSDEDGVITVRGARVPGAGKSAAAVAPDGSAKGERPSPCHEGSGDVAVLITRGVLGGNDPVLGEVLIKSFLGTLAQLPTPPSAVALMNEGVKLALGNTATCDHLTALQSKGANVLVCGTCTNHFGITQDVGVGTVSNMFEITEALLGAGKVLTI